MSVTGFLVNGWNNVKDNNDAKTVGVSLGMKPNAKTGLFLNYLVGNEFADDVDGGTRKLIRHRRHLRAERQDQPARQLRLRHATRSMARTWPGTAWPWAFKYQATDKFAFSPRFEWFVDDDGFATGLKQTLSGESR